jgi:hypothetical protein
MASDLTGEINQTPGQLTGTLVQTPGQLGGAVSNPVGEAPKDGVPYVRKDGLWEDGNLYFNALTKIKHITAADSPYQALPEEFILADATGGAITINAPATPDSGMRFGVKKTDESINLITINSSSSFEGRFLTTAASGSLYAENETFSYIYNQTGDRWQIESSHGLAEWVEVYNATALPAIGTTPETIQWTFVPLFTGQPQLLVSLASGVFTVQVPIFIRVDITALWEFVMAANNQDALGLVDMTHTGTGSAGFIELVNSFAHPRTGTFYMSNNTGGSVDGVVNDTFSFTAVSDVAQSGVTNLAEATLALAVG